MLNDAAPVSRMESRAAPVRVLLHLALFGLALFSLALFSAISGVPT
jgi:hypothetical protein